MTSIGVEARTTTPVRVELELIAIMLATVTVAVITALAICGWSTPHLAALRTKQPACAAPGSIQLTAETLRLVEGLVDVNPLGPAPNYRQSMTRARSDSELQLRMFHDKPSTPGHFS